MKTSFCKQINQLGRKSLISIILFVFSYNSGLAQAEDVEVIIGDSIQISKEQMPPFSPASVTLKENFATIPDPVNVEIDSIRLNSDSTGLVSYIKIHLDSTAVPNQSYPKDFCIIYLRGQMSKIYAYKLNVIAKGMATPIVPMVEQNLFELHHNYPNPLSSTTTFNFTNKKYQKIAITIFDHLGKEVRKIELGKLTPGNQRVVFDANGLPNGYYYYQLSGGNVKQTRQLLIQK